MKYITLLLSLAAPLFLAAPWHAAAQAPAHAIALRPTPVLNGADFAAVFGGSDGSTLNTDSSGQVRAVEFVALTGTPFRIIQILSGSRGTIYRVTTDDYPYPTKTGYYIDSRFVSVTSTEPSPRQRKLPPLEKVVENLLAAQGSRYVWGGNVREGVPEMLSLFAPRRALDNESARRWQLRGVDCSGLLYEATGGYTPRNTSALVSYGKAVKIAGRSANEIVTRMEPLDLIVWNGHVLIALDSERLIESCLTCSGGRDGVRVRPLKAALEEIMKGRQPLDDYRDAAKRGVKGFVVRRWYDR